MVAENGLMRFPGQFPRSSSNHMTRKLARFLLATLFVFSVAALAQTASGDPALPSAPSATPAATAPDPSAGGTGNRIGTINIEQAIFASNEGQRDFEALSKKLEPKQTELKSMNDEVESLKKQLSNDKLNDDSRGTLVKQVEDKQKKLERSVQDARDDAQAQQNEIAQRILQKMAPIIVKYAGDKGFGLIMDTSNPWPQGPVLWAGPSVDITKAIVDAYNVQSGVAAPIRPVTTKPAGAGTSTRPAAPAANKPATTTPAPK
jgi:outer membrane protein